MAEPSSNTILKALHPKIFTIFSLTIIIMPFMAYQLYKPAIRQKSPLHIVQAFLLTLISQYQLSNGKSLIIYRSVTSLAGTCLQLYVKRSQSVLFKTKPISMGTNVWIVALMVVWLLDTLMEQFNAKIAHKTNNLILNMESASARKALSWEKQISVNK